MPDQGSRIGEWNMKRGLIKATSVSVAAGMLFHGSGCQISPEQSLVWRNLSILAGTLVRGALLAPLDRFLSNAANNLFDTPD